MKVFFSLPRGTPATLEEFYSIDTLGRIARSAEDAGFDACAVTEHPIPGLDDLKQGGHHAPDPFVVLSVVAAHTAALRLHTRVLVLPYRNPFLTAKSVASLDALSGGRVVLGVGAGFSESEFEALGVRLADRNQLTDEAIVTMRKVWTGFTVVAEGLHFTARGNVSLPRPLQEPHPPIWVGGNSRRAIRRAVELADGWLPFPSSPKLSEFTRSASLTGKQDLAARIRYARDYAEAIGRTTPLEISLVQPPGWWSRSGELSQPEAIVEAVTGYAEVGVTNLQVAIPGDSCDEFMGNLEWFGGKVLPLLAKL